MNRKERQELHRAALSRSVLNTALQLPQAEQLEAQAAAELRPAQAPAEQLEAPAEQAEQAEQADTATIVPTVRALEVVLLLRSASVILRTAASIAEKVPGLGSFEQGADILSARCITTADQLQTKLMQ